MSTQTTAQIPLFVYTINADPSKKVKSYQSDTFHIRKLISKKPLDTWHSTNYPELDYLLSRKHANNKHVIYIVASEEIEAIEQYMNYKFGTESAYWLKHLGLTTVYNNPKLKYLHHAPITALPYQNSVKT